VPAHLGGLVGIRLTMTCSGEYLAYRAGREDPTCTRCGENPCAPREWGYGGGLYDLCERCMEAEQNSLPVVSAPLTGGSRGIHDNRTCGPVGLFERDINFYP
jgi:hypothetical protein